MLFFIVERVGFIMEKAYFLNDYVNELDENQKESLQANSSLDSYLFRTTGVKTVDELKKEVEKFLEQNNVDSELKDELISICESLNEDSNLYMSSLKLENAIRDYVYDKNKSLERSNQEVEEVKSNLIQDNINRLDEVGIHISGDTNEIKDSIKTEDDVYHLERQVDATVDYYQNRNELYNNSSILETTATTLEKAIENSGTQILNTVLEEENNKLNVNNSIDVNDDGTIEFAGSSKDSESMNFIFMMTTLLVANNPNFSLNTNMDMKFIKEKEEVDDFKVIYGNFPVLPDGFQMDPVLKQRIYDLANSYDPNTSYDELLNSISPELKMALQIVEENVLGQAGEFKMAVKTNGNSHDIKMGFDSNYQDLINAFYENGAFTTEGMNETVVVLLPDGMDQIILLNAVLETLKQKGYTEEQVNNLTNQYQKKLVYKNEVANVPFHLLITITIVCVIEIVGLLYFIMK